MHCQHMLYRNYRIVEIEKELHTTSVPTRSMFYITAQKMLTWNFY